ncbi:follistatin-related protein 1-like [Gambusia affinis]|uniref:follistatin-related protein 1-like n=1 Tax=Gambusia affinis TaxID=33528 RepID=UPI001CDCDD72|nr:follistatin-related protein 1-like [Gambusia affinis]
MENLDWKLSLPQFINCLTPIYHPQERKSALEDEMFEDGAETHRECNVCVGLQELGVHCSDMPQGTSGEGARRRRRRNDR